MTDAMTLDNRIRDFRARLDRASARWGRVEICAATKTVDAQTINLIYDLGIHTIGENRVQELREKLPALKPEFNVHLIGQLQSNKVKYIVHGVDMVQSLDRLALAEELSARCERAGLRMDALVQVNIAGEAGKSGAAEEAVRPLLRAAGRMDGLCVRGLMAMMPLAPDPEAVRPWLRRMRALFDQLREEAIPGVRMETLSMGMSGDCLVAAEEGATMVRIGSGLFGARATR